MKEDKLTILIVDDEESIRNILSRKLELDGYDCEVAADGKEALRKASTKSFALVLLDIKLPGLSGMEVLRRLTADYPDTCVVMITATADTTTHIEALRLGAYDYVTKPFDLDDVSARVKRALDIRRLILKKGGRQLSPQQNEAIWSLMYGRIPPEELKTIHWPQDGESPPGTELAILTFGSTTHPRELARYMQMALKLLLLGEAFRDSIGGDGEWAGLPGEEIADQPGDYDDLIEMLNGLNIATIPDVSGKIHILDYGLIESTSLTLAEYSGLRVRHISTDTLAPQLEHLRDTVFIAGAPDKRQRENGYHSNSACYTSQFQHSNKEIFEAVMKSSREQRDSCAVDYLSQILERQAMKFQFPTLAGT